MTPGRHLPELEQAIMARNGKRTGDEIAFCCAAHEDKNPSVSYSTSKNTWYCYACGASGGYVDLSERLGVSLPDRDLRPGLPMGFPAHGTAHTSSMHGHTSTRTATNSVTLLDMRVLMERKSSPSSSETAPGGRQTALPSLVRSTGSIDSILDQKLR